jgi:hypothetical protein
LLLRAEERWKQVSDRVMHLVTAVAVGLAATVLLSAPEAAADNCSDGCFFSSPSRKMYCFMKDNDPGTHQIADCRWIDFGPPLSGHDAFLSSDGTMSTTYYVPGDASLCAECFRGGVNSPVLPYGAAVTWGALVCSSATDGFTCTTTVTGHGFKINSSGIYPV